MLVLYQFVIAYQYSRPSLRNITDAEYARSISDSAHIPTVHSGTEPGPHGFGLGFCAAAYDSVCSSTSSMPYDR